MDPVEIGRATVSERDLMACCHIKIGREREKGMKSIVQTKSPNIRTLLCLLIPVSTLFFLLPPKIAKSSTNFSSISLDQLLRKLDRDTIWVFGKPDLKRLSEML